jgi:hypothetical protein
MRGSHDQCRWVPVIGQLPGHIETRLLARADSDQHDIRPQGLGALHRLGATTGRAGHGYLVPLQHGLRPFDACLVVIDYHAPYLHATIFSGNETADIAASRGLVRCPSASTTLVRPVRTMIIGHATG